MVSPFEFLNNLQFWGAGCVSCRKVFNHILTINCHGVNGTSERLAIHNSLALVLARREASEEAHPVVVVGRHFIPREDTPQDDMGVGV